MPNMMTKEIMIVDENSIKEKSLFFAWSKGHVRL